MVYLVSECCHQIMEKKSLHGLCLILMLTCGCLGRIVKKCNLAGEMLKISHPNYQPDKIDLWLCIAEKASNYNTSAISKTRFTEDLRLGIFMVNSVYTYFDDHHHSCPHIFNHN